MNYRSVSTTCPDPFRAGYSIGSRLLDLHPELVVFFSAVTEGERFPEFFDGLYEGLGTRDTLVFGGTGDGIYQNDLVANYGICALGISSAGAVRWHIAEEPGVKEDSFGAASRCAERILKMVDRSPHWAMVLADGGLADGSGIVAGVNRHFAIPFFGGLTGSDRRLGCPRQYVNGRTLENSVAILAAEGAFDFRVHAASGWHSLGVTGTIERTVGNRIERISGVSPQQFIQQQLGKPLSQADLGIVSLGLLQDDSAHPFFLRSASHLDTVSGSIQTFGAVPEGARVKVCQAGGKEVLAGVENALDGLDLPTIVQGAAIVISCAGRKWLLEDDGVSELELIKKVLGKDVPVIGFPSFGEISPFRQGNGAYTQPFFHNVTMAIMVLGE